MRYSKLLIVSASIIAASLTYAACTGTACFNEGVDFGNQAKPSSSSISNSVLESAVGANNITQAQASQDSIQSAMGNDYKNIDGITNAGNTKAQACIGKDTAECKAYNYYNDPLTKLSQQGIESAVGVASNLINKKIEQNVSLTDYCAQHPSDSICKMCKDDPSQPMCQSGNKCTTISYNTGDNKYVTNGCKIIGQRSYDCDKWVDSISFTKSTYECNPNDGSCDQYQRNSLCTLTQYYIEPVCKQYTYFSNYGSCKVGQGSCDVPSTFHTPGCGGSKGRDYECGTCSTGGDPGDHNACWGQTCSKWEPGQPAIYTCKVVNKVNWKDNCNN